MAEYVIDTRKYDYDEIFTNAIKNISDWTPANFLDDRRIMRYRTKTIKSGNVLECEIYPIWNTRLPITRAKKEKESRAAQKHLNDKNAVKYVVRLANVNFTDRDTWGTFTYNDDKLPQTVEEAERIFGNYIRRLKYYAKKHGFPPLKYIYWTEFENDEKKGKHRVHHHIMSDFPDRDVMEKLWHGGARTQTRRLQADENGYEGAVRYCMKDPKGTKRYKTSKNLKKPQVTVSDCKFSRGKINRLVRGALDPKTAFEKIYDGYKFTDCTCKISDFVSGAYVYVKMSRKQETKRRKGNSRE